MSAKPKHWASGWPLVAWGLLAWAAGANSQTQSGSALLPARKTIVSIVGDEFYLNGKPTYAGRFWAGHRIQGLLLNARLVQGIFDDRNPETVSRWAYFDPGKSNYADGYQSPPVNWGINTERKRAFFRLVSELAGTNAR